MGPSPDSAGKGTRGGLRVAHDSQFYKTLFSMLSATALQSLVAYSVNITDNIMLGSYSQGALSGAATVNQIFFMVQQVALCLGIALSVLASQYWGEGRSEPIRTLTGIALRLSIGLGAVLTLVCALFPERLVGIFTTSPDILAQGVSYLRIIQWSFVPFMVSNLLTSSLRSVGDVRFAFYVSVMSLVVNAGANYALIFGRLGLPALGVVGAGIGTLFSRVLELAVIVAYLGIRERRICLRWKDLLARDARLGRDYARVLGPFFVSQLAWAVSVPIQTAILGHLSDDAIAANSVATTFYTYLKVFVTAMASTSLVIIGNAIGRGDLDRVRIEAHTLELLYLVMGVILGGLLFLLRGPLLSLYHLNDTAMELSSHLIAIMAVVMVGMSYEMPVSNGILQGGGDVRYTMVVNTASMWCIVMPLSFAAAFLWKWPVEAVVVALQSDQIFKCLPYGLRLHGWKWVRKLTG